ncbi:MAG: hypothetical protein ACRDWV_06475 [Acidimicrobiales bacterium]
MAIKVAAGTEEVAALRQRYTCQRDTEADAARGLALAPALDELEQRATELDAQNHQQRDDRGVAFPEVAAPARGEAHGPGSS